MYVIVAELKIEPDKMEVFEQFAYGQAKNSVELEEECHQFDICQDENDSSAFLFYEVYSNKAAFDLHTKTDHFDKFFAEVGSMIVEKSIRGFNRHAP